VADGKTISFLSQKGGFSGRIIERLQTTSPEDTDHFTERILLYHTLTHSIIPTQAGGGGKIVYSIPTGSGQTTDTYLFDIDEDREILIISNNQTYMRDYSWSPDGKQIVFSSFYQTTMVTIP
jgi:hypothetical protein